MRQRVLNLPWRRQKDWSLVTTWHYPASWLHFWLKSRSTTRSRYWTIVKPLLIKASTKKKLQNSIEFTPCARPGSPSARRGLRRTHATGNILSNTREWTTRAARASIYPCESIVSDKNYLGSWWGTAIVGNFSAKLDKGRPSHPCYETDYSLSASLLYDLPIWHKYTQLVQLLQHSNFYGCQTRPVPARNALPDKTDVKVREEIKCEAEGDPPPQIFSWQCNADHEKDEDDDWETKNRLLIIKNPKDYHCICVASNIIDIRAYHSIWNGTITAQSGYNGPLNIIRSIHCASYKHISNMDMLASAKWTLELFIHCLYTYIWLSWYVKWLNVWNLGAMIKLDYQ